MGEGGWKTSPQTTQRAWGWHPEGWGEGLWEGIPRQGRGLGCHDN